MLIKKFFRSLRTCICIIRSRNSPCVGRTGEPDSKRGAVKLVPSLGCTTMAIDLSAILLVYIILLEEGCGNFRTTPKKGRPHPHLPPEQRYNRTWVYLHPPFENDDHLTPAEREYRIMREIWARNKADLYRRLVVSIDKLYRAVEIGAKALVLHKLAGTGESWFIQNQYREGLEETSGDSSPSAYMIGLAENIVNGCLMGTPECQARVTSHTHEGDDPDDTELYYDVISGVFPYNNTNGVVRVVFVEIARFGKAKSGGLADIQKVVPLFLSENPTTDEAWIPNPEFPSDEQPMVADYTELLRATFDHTNTTKALFNFLYNQIDDPLGLRLTEFVAFRNDEGRGEITTLSSQVNVYHVKWMEFDDIESDSNIKHEEN